MVDVFFGFLNPVIACLNNPSTSTCEYKPSTAGACIEDIHGQPWAQAYDILNDGVFGSDDMKAYVTPPHGNPVDSCKVARMGLLKEEVTWKLKSLLAGKIPNHETNAPEIDALERDALNRLQQLASDKPDRKAVIENRAAIVEMCLRAKTTLINPTTEPFGIGISFKPAPTSEKGWPLVVTSVMADGGAARVGLHSGDQLMAVDGNPFSTLSSDGTVSGLYDPQTHLSRGFSGSWGSIMHLQVRRTTGELVELQVTRNIWSARHLGTPNTLPLWDGKELPTSR